jgi:hypothetical protein
MILQIKRLNNIYISYTLPYNNTTYNTIDNIEKVYIYKKLILI